MYADRIGAKGGHGPSPFAGAGPNKASGCASGYLLLLCDWGGLTSAPDVVRGDLEAIEELSSTPRIDLGRGNGAENLAEPDLDGTAVFQGREFERSFRDSPSALCGAAPRGMEIAIGHAAEGRRMALGAAGHDMTTFWTHTPPTIVNLQGS